MFDIKVLSRENVEELLKMPEVISAVEGVYKEKAKDNAVAWPTVFYEFNPGVSDMDIRSGWLKGAGVYGMKLVSFFGENKEKNLPTLTGVIVIADAETGRPLGVLDGSYITGIRTGAAGAIGAKYLANPDSENLLILGAGNVAAFQVAATLALMPRIKNVRVCDPLSFKAAEDFCSAIPERINNLGADVSADVSFMAVDISQLDKAVSASQIIITVTPSKSPIIKKDWVSPGTHFSCIGADMEGKEEIAPEIFAEARVFVDDIPHCIEAGETEIPIKKGIITKDGIAAEIGEVILGMTTGRENTEQITIYDACGMALLDLATAKMALERASEEDQGFATEL